jgi:hypothetical protein
MQVQIKEQLNQENCTYVHNFFKKETNKTTLGSKWKNDERVKAFMDFLVSAPKCEKSFEPLQTSVTSVCATLIIPLKAEERSEFQLKNFKTIPLDSRITALNYRVRCNVCGFPQSEKF